MTSRERVINVIRHKEIDRFPMHMWALPNVNMFKQDLLNDFNSKFDIDFGYPDLSFGVSRYSKGTACVIGNYTDEFGCEWSVAENGVIGEVKNPIFNEWSELDYYKMPWEIIDEMDLSRLNESCKKSDKFMLVGTHIRPFERMQFFRGTENLLMDLISGEPEAEKLGKMLHEFNMKELDKLVNTEVDGISFMDDWGTQRSLLINPALWREIFKPMYKDYCDLAHSKGKFVFFHSDGNIESIYPDLIEIGIDAINSQLFCMDMEGLIEKHGDKITFWGEIDRQNILPFGSTDDVKKAVDRVADKVIAKNGKRTGAIAQCEWNAFDPYENVKAVFEQWSIK